MTFLKQNNHHVYRNLFSKAKTINLLIDPATGAIIDANERACRYYGYTYDELTSMFIHQINTLPEEAVRHEMEQAEREQRTFFLFSHRLKSGEIRQVQVYSSAVPMGEAVCLHSVIFDIEEKHRAERGINVEREQFRSILDSIPHNIYVADQESYEVLFVNRAMKDLLGYDIVGRPCYEVLQHRKSVCPFCTNPHLTDSDEPYEWEYYNPILRRHYRAVDRRVTWSDGRAARFEIASDITSFKQIEEELRRLNETKDVLLSIIAHDLRQPFLNIMSLMELLLAESPSPSPEERREYGRLLRDSTTATYRLLENLLVWSRSQSDRLEYQPVALDVTDVVKAVYDVASSASKAKGVNLSLDLEEPCTVVGDPDLLVLLFNNLVFNALKFTPSGGDIVVSTRSEDGHGVVSVRDTGVGMRPDDANRLFSPHGRRSTRGTDGEPGTGLGLLIVHDVVKRHGATIRIESEPKRGTAVECRFPATFDAAPTEHHELPGV